LPHQCRVPPVRVPGQDFHLRSQHPYLAHPSSALQPPPCRALGWGGRGAGVRPDLRAAGERRTRAQETPKDMLGFPNPTPRRRFGKSSMTIAQLPERAPGDRIWEVERVSGARPRLAAAHRPAPRTPRHSPEVRHPAPLPRRRAPRATPRGPAPAPLHRGRHPVPDIPSTKRRRRRLKADDGCATPIRPYNPTHRNGSSARIAGGWVSFPLGRLARPRSRGRGVRA
jgi:hypothetical protein